MTPDFQIFIDGVDITSRINDRLLSLTVNDAAGTKSDTVRIVLDDRGNRIAEPPDGALIRVFMGYKGLPLVHMGTFVLDTIDYNIAPDKMIITGKAADFGGTIKDQKTRNWDGMALPDIVTTIAKEHGLAPKIADRFRNVRYDYLAQKAESDINFLTRTGKEHDALVSIKDQSLLFLGKGAGKSASGITLPQTWIYKSQLLPGSRVSKNKAVAYKSIAATWHNKQTGEKETVKAGEGSPVFEVTHVYSSKKTAQQGAQAKLDEQARTGHSISLKVLGNPIMRAEGQLVIVGLRSGIPTTWSMEAVAHRLSGGGYTCGIGGELPTDEAANLKSEEPQSDLV